MLVAVFAVNGNGDHLDRRKVSVRSSRRADYGV